MIRSQILLTKELDERISFLATKQNISKSELIRKYLEQGIIGGKPNSDRNIKVNKFYYELAEFTKKNPRIQGFKELYSVGGKTVNVKIIDHDIFAYYRRHSSFPAGFERDIIKMVEILKESSKTKTLVVRRAYVVPGLDNPPGPRFLGLQSHEVIDSLKKLYDFAIEQKYHTLKGSQICAFIYPFADPEPIDASKTISSLPYGGYAVPLNDDVTKVEIFATWGNNEGVQSLNSIDRYIVNTQRMIIESKAIPQKDVMLATTTRKQSEKMKVPMAKQFEQVLSDAEILEVARVVKDLKNQYDLRRVEFSYDGISSIVFNESIPYRIIDADYTDFTSTGHVFVVNDWSDISKLVSLTDKEIRKTIVYIVKAIVEERKYDILNSIATLRNKCVVLYPGLSATAHAMRVLTDFGHKAFVVGNKVFENGDHITITVKDLQVFIQRAKVSQYNDYYVSLYDAHLEDTNHIGGKARNLSILKSKGINTPHGIVLTTTYCDKAVVQIKSSQGDYESELLAILKAANLKKDVMYAVRSSANLEDNSKYSFAGQFESYLNVSYEDIPKAVEKVICSLRNNHIDSYLGAIGKKVEDLKMAVVVQEMIDAEKSGVTFGIDIQTNNDDLIIINVKEGLADGIVDGTSQTHKIIYSRSRGRLITPESQMLDKQELQTIIEMTMSLERLMGARQDIEWAIDKKHRLWILQTRDMIIG